MEQGFVVAGLELVGTDQEAVGVLLDFVGDVGRRKAVQDGLVHGPAAVVVLPREGDDGPVGTLALLQVGADGVDVLDGPLNAVGDHHGPRLAVDLALGDHLFMEVIHHDFRLVADGVLVPFHVAPQLLPGLVGVELRVVRHGLGQPVVAVDRCVVLEHVQDEPLLDGLLHAVDVKRTMPHRAVTTGLRVTENLQRPVFRGGGEGVIAGVGEQLAGRHQTIDPVLASVVLPRFSRLPQGSGHGRAGLAPLAGMGLVDDDGEAAAPLLVADLVKDEGELLDCGDDDLLALGNEAAQIPRPFGVRHRGPHLGVLADGVADLLVQNAAIGDHNDGLENGLAVSRQPDELMGQPGDGIALAAAGRVLDQIPSPCPVLLTIRQESAHHVPLVIPGPDLDTIAPARFPRFRRHHLGVVLQDIGHALPAEDVAPKVVCLEPIRVGRVAAAAVPTLVERQKPRCLAPELGAEVNLAFVNGEVGHTTPELEQGFPRVAIPLVLGNGVLERLFGETVLQLEGEDRQPIDEQHHIQRPLGVVPAVAKLAGDAEPVLAKAALGRLVVGGGGAVEQLEVVGAVPDAVAEHVNGAPLGDLPLEAGQELVARRAVLLQTEGGGGVWLGGVEERVKLDQVNAILAVVVVMVAGGPAAALAGGWLTDGGAGGGIARVAGERPANEAFQAAFGEIDGHGWRLRTWAANAIPS